MAENWVTVKGDISSVLDLDSFKDFFGSLKTDKDKSSSSLLKVLIVKQNISYDTEKFRWKDYLSSIQSVKIKKNKKSITFKAEFNTGTGVSEFCKDMYELLKELKVKKLKITAIDDDEFDEIDWKTETSKSFKLHIFPGLMYLYGFRKPYEEFLENYTGVVHSYVNNQLDGVINVKNGHLHGLQTLLQTSDNSKSYAEIGYLEGSLHGSMKFFHPNGNLNIEATFNEGVLSGKTAAYYPDNSLAVNAFYANNMLSGKQYFYDSQGICVYEADYLNGLPHGIATVIDNDNKYLVKFNSGVLVEIISSYVRELVEKYHRVLWPLDGTTLIYVEPEALYDTLKDTSLIRI